MENLLDQFSIGLAFWQTILFLGLLLLLRKYAWKPILNSVNERESKISESLELAEKTRAEMETMKAQNENLLKEARAERDALIKDAKETVNTMIEDAKGKAREEADKVQVSAREAFAAEKSAAIAELKTQVASISIEIAEKVVRGELGSQEKQTSLANKLVEDINMN
ncbi:MAG: F0F1 ATP synthase subunit B [Crocinitomicaceae bacterium]|nr:F0F1 ATP synthase subunit B [Crocinitomicaceae bacterium]MDG1657195.1 F0F1 ATP synthase subunit B [Crocinitomicaceae bacterium]